MTTYIDEILHEIIERLIFLGAAIGGYHQQQYPFAAWPPPYSLSYGPHQHYVPVICNTRVCVFITIAYICEEFVHIYIYMGK